MNRKLTASLLILAAVLANVAFTALGSIFNYPDVLDEPAGEVLASFRDAPGRRERLVLGPRALRRAARADRDRRRPTLAPSGRCGSRCRSGSPRRVVQVIGLLRWPILVPGYASDAASGDPAVAADARDSFTTAGDILGTAIGETLGYLLTAAWTALVVVALGRRYAGRWFPVLGGRPRRSSLVGVFSPLDLPVVDTANFFGYVLWSLWLIAFGVVILVRERRAAARSSPRAPGGDVVSRRPRPLARARRAVREPARDRRSTTRSSTSRCRRWCATSDADVSELQWVVDAYTLVFAGLLLAGRRARRPLRAHGARCSSGS